MRLNSDRRVPKLRLLRQDLTFLSLDSPFIPPFQKTQRLLYFAYTILSVFIERLKHCL